MKLLLLILFYLLYPHTCAGMFFQKVRDTFSRMHNALQELPAELSDFIHNLTEDMPNENYERPQSYGYIPLKNSLFTPKKIMEFINKNQEQKISERRSLLDKIEYLKEKNIKLPVLLLYEKLITTYTEESKPAFYIKMNEISEEIKIEEENKKKHLQFVCALAAINVEIRLAENNHNILSSQRYALSMELHKKKLNLYKHEDTQYQLIQNKIKNLMLAFIGTIPDQQSKAAMIQEYLNSTKANL